MYILPPLLNFNKTENELFSIGINSSPGNVLEFATVNKESKVNTLSALISMFFSPNKLSDQDITK